MGWVLSSSAPEQARMLDFVRDQGEGGAHYCRITRRDIHYRVGAE
jgi:hypothetical protein